MRTRHLAGLVGALTALLVAAALPATAQTGPTNTNVPPTNSGSGGTGTGLNGTGQLGSGGVGATGGAPGGTPVSSGGSGGGGGGSGGPACTYLFLASQKGGIIYSGPNATGAPSGPAFSGQSGANSGGAGIPTGPQAGGTPIPGSTDGNWYTLSCPGQSDRAVFGLLGAGGVVSPPPRPPAPGEVAASAPFPAETIRHDPCFAGLTGLPAFLWATVNNAAVQPISATTDIRGYTVTTTAHPVSYRWSLGNGDSRNGVISGTDQSPSITYTYQKKGVYQLTLTVMWAGTFRFTGFGIVQTQDLGTVSQAPQHLSWPVEEISSVLADPTATETTTTLAVPRAC